MLEVARKHILFFRENNIPVKIGDVSSYKNCPNPANLTLKSELIIEGIDYKKNLKPYKVIEEFYLGCRDKVANKKLFDFIEYLKIATHKYAKTIQINSHNKECNIIILPAVDDIPPSNYPIVLKCQIIEFDPTAAPIHAPTPQEAKNIHPEKKVLHVEKKNVGVYPTKRPSSYNQGGSSPLLSGASEIIIDENLDIQPLPKKPTAIAPLPSSPSSLASEASTAAASHYNSLVRNRETRHHTNLYHMRNFNNFIKNYLINHIIIKLLYKKPSYNYSNGLRVLDLACGKGGDMQKWLNNPLDLKYYIGSDIAKESLNDFIERIHNLNTKKSRNYNQEYIKRVFLKLIEADLGTENLLKNSLNTYNFHPISDINNIISSTSSTSSFTLSSNFSPSWTKEVPLNDKIKFDVISCQFAFHYFFKSKEIIENFFYQLNKTLEVNGLFVFTTIDCRVLYQYFLLAYHGSHDEPTDSKYEKIQVKGSSPDKPPRIRSYFITQENPLTKCSEKAIRVTVENELDDRLLNITISEENFNILRTNYTNFTKNNVEGDFFSDENISNYYGIQYQFQLIDLNHSEAVNAPEFIVPLGSAFTSLISKYNFDIVLVNNFYDLIRNINMSKDEIKKKYLYNKLKNFGCFNYNNTLDDGEWSIIRLYSYVVLRKKNNEYIPEDYEEFKNISNEDKIKLVNEKKNQDLLSTKNYNNQLNKIKLEIKNKLNIKLNEEDYSSIINDDDDDIIESNIYTDNKNPTDHLLSLLNTVNRDPYQQISSTPPLSFRTSYELPSFLNEISKNSPPSTPDYPPPPLNISSIYSQYTDYFENKPSSPPYEYQKMNTNEFEEEILSKLLKKVEDNKQISEEDEMELLLKIRSIAVEMAGGEEEWETLTEIETENYLELARSQLDLY